MSYYLDTDTCIFALKNTHPVLVERIKSLSPDRLKIPAVVEAELLFGAENSLDSKRILETVQRFLDPFEIVPFDSQCAQVYSKIRREVEKKGSSVGPNDLLIAATVSTHHGILVTHNVREFNHISHLKIEDWTK